MIVALSDVLSYVQDTRDVLEAARDKATGPLVDEIESNLRKNDNLLRNAGWLDEDALDVNYQQ